MKMGNERNEGEEARHEANSKTSVCIRNIETRIVFTAARLLSLPLFYHSPVLPLLALLLLLFLSL